jgi:uncharacterized protein YjbI with pentapeptide repeats
MADEEQLKIIHQGSRIWNDWRKDNGQVEIDLCRTNLSGFDLKGADLVHSDLNGANLTGANLNKANLIEANLRGANLGGTNLNRANLSGADLSGAKLIDTNLRGANLGETNFQESVLSGAVFVSTDLSSTKGLESIWHQGATILGTDTLFLSKGKIHEAFLRGCGLSDWEIESAKLYDPDLSNEEINKILYKMYDIRATQALQLSPLFISYSHADSNFVDRVEKALDKKGIRFWRDIHDMKAGRMEKQIDRAIRQNPTVLLILSENSTKSDWIEHEVRLARKLEKATERDVLCPVALDDRWKTSPWPERIMEQIMEYNLLDFSEWADARFEKTFKKLIDGLNLFYKKDDKS